MGAVLSLVFQESALPRVRHSFNRRYRAQSCPQLVPPASGWHIWPRVASKLDIRRSGVRMRRLVRWVLVALIVCAASTGSALATTYYISTGGSDSNDGMSKTTSWAHLPGMQTWSGSHTPAPGDTFILRGCDDWGNANFPITWTWSGSGGSPITIDRDTTWYNTTNCPSSWNRPVFDAGNAPINAPENCPSSMGLHYFLYVNGANYVNFNWIEAKNLYWNVDAAGACWGSGGNIEANNSDNLIWNNWYFHRWTHGASATENIGLIGRAASKCTHCVLSSVVIDNSDGDGADCAGKTAIIAGQHCSSGGIGNFSLVDSICANVVECALVAGYPGATIEIGGNNFYNVAEGFSPQHGNVIETTGVIGSGTVTFLIHDNYTHNIYGVEALQIGNPNEIDYVWNNIIDADPVANGPQIPQNTNGAGPVYIWNNTIRYAAGCARVGQHSTSFTALQIQNNHCINDAMIDLGIVSGSISRMVNSNDVVMSNATATSQGFTSSQSYPFSTTSQTDNTVGAHANLTSTTPGCGTPGLAALCSDTTGYATRQTINGVVTAVPGSRKTNSRGSAWNAGAYQYNAASQASVNPPTGLTAVVQ